MTKILNTNVTVHNPKTGESKTLPTGTVVTEEIEGLITNPDVFGETEQEQAPTPGPSQTSVFDPESDEAVAKAGSEGGSEDVYGSGPFRSRSAAQVKALAESYGLDVNTKEEAIAALEAEGVDPDAKQDDAE